MPSISLQYETKPFDECCWEAHRKYRDVRYVVSGIERIGFGNITRMEPTTEHDPETDLIHLKGDADLLTVSEGMFAIFNSHDVHMPGIVAEVGALVRKVVVKASVQ